MLAGKHKFYGSFRERGQTRDVRKRQDELWGMDDAAGYGSRRWEWRLSSAAGVRTAATEPGRDSGPQLCGVPGELLAVCRDRIAERGGATGGERDAAADLPWALSEHPSGTGTTSPRDADPADEQWPRCNPGTACIGGDAGGDRVGAERGVPGPAYKHRGSDSRSHWAVPAICGHRVVAAVERGVADAAGRGAGTAAGHGTGKDSFAVDRWHADFYRNRRWRRVRRDRIYPELAGGAVCCAGATEDTAGDAAQQGADRRRQRADLRGLSDHVVPVSGRGHDRDAAEFADPAWRKTRAAAYWCTGGDAAGELCGVLDGCAGDDDRAVTGVLRSARAAGRTGSAADAGWQGKRRNGWQCAGCVAGR